jgi:hypothetical protein
MMVLLTTAGIHLLAGSVAAQSAIWGILLPLWAELLCAHALKACMSNRVVLQQLPPSAVGMLH